LDVKHSSLRLNPAPVKDHARKNINSTIGAADSRKAFAPLLSGKIRETNAPSGNGSLKGDDGPHLISLGAVTGKTATVSELIFKSPLKDRCWNIIYDKVNEDKPFKRIKSGTQIFFNPRNKELLWGKEAAAALAKEAMPESNGVASVHRVAEVKPGVQHHGVVEPDTDSRLAEAVRPFIGRDYDQMDCYELVVGGLKNLGIQYQGPGGLGERLIKRASENGVAANRYLNGEGLVSESGRKVFKKTFFSIKDPQNQADKTMDEIQGVLREGQILSFSTRSRGHTGIISRKDGVWTFINSGEMDHNLSGRNGIRGVGEESLKDEIQNWFELAGKRKEGLKITLGSLDMKRLARFGQKRGFSQRA